VTTTLDLDADSLLAGVDAGRALPSYWYTDPQIYRAELDRVLRRSWHYATHTGELANVGDVTLRDIAGIPIVLTRAGDGRIRGFVNICRHRAHPVVLEPGNRKRETMQCLYHGWTYDFEGALLRAPRAEYEKLEFEREACGLVPVQTHVWGPTVWVNPDLGAPSFDQWTEGLAEEVAANGTDVADNFMAIERDFDIRANWKVFLDNAIECYHCPTCHSRLSSVLVMNPHRQRTTIGNRFWSTHMIPYRDEDRMYYFHWIFPATYFQYTGAGFDVGSIEVVSLDRIIFKSFTFVPNGTPADEISTRAKQLDESPTIPEDVAICERVQRSHEVGIAPPGRLLPWSEHLVLHFQRTLISMMTAR
jgi:phenylpropionate dioxygenase-like ring-hydroxylating dioxygenase large terminal subunit